MSVKRRSFCTGTILCAFLWAAIGASAQERVVEMLSQVQTQGESYGVAVQGDVAYLIDGVDIVVLDVSIPESPEPLTRLTITDVEWLLDIEAVRDVLVVAAGREGIRVVDIAEPTGLAVIGSYSEAGLRVESIAMAEGVVFAADSLSPYSLRSIDLSDPSDPVEIGSFDTGFQVKDMVLRGDTLFAALNNNDNGFQVFNVRVPELISLRGTYAPQDWGTSVATAGNTGLLGKKGKVDLLDVTSLGSPELIETYTLEDFNQSPDAMVAAEGLARVRA